MACTVKALPHRDSNTGQWIQPVLDAVASVLHHGGVHYRIESEEQAQQVSIVKRKDLEAWPLANKADAIERARASAGDQPGGEWLALLGLLFDELEQQGVLQDCLRQPYAGSMEFPGVPLLQLVAQQAVGRIGGKPILASRRRLQCLIHSYRYSHGLHATPGQVEVEADARDEAAVAAAVVALMVERGADVRQQGPSCVTALHVCSTAPVASLLLDLHADPLAVDGAGRTAELAVLSNPGAWEGGAAEALARRGHVESVPPAMHLRMAFSHSELSGCLRIWQRRCGGKPMTGELELGEALVEAAGEGRTAHVRMLLQELRLSPNSAGAEDASGNSPLHLAASNGHAAIVSQLLRHGADANFLNHEGLRPVELAQRYGHVGVCRLLTPSSCLAQ